ncbi:hypothetical protein BC751_3899 [Cecembia calidifontis]|uniref:Uncharacterized protein n=1 Tax=Cecembia calidifontis TaxID=1187080 RepID=A0A4V2F717_9BACT|nr:hypothetical protein BC751_3899 [Cecembia calidifontis]
MKKLAISISPHVSGPYTQYLNLKKGLIKYDWEVIGVSLNQCCPK